MFSLKLKKEGSMSFLINEQTSIVKTIEIDGVKLFDIGLRSRWAKHRKAEYLSPTMEPKMTT